MQKIWTIAWKELYTTYTDRNLILIMIVTPLALATIIGLALGQFIGNSSNDVPVQDIPVALVNLDEGEDQVDFILGDVYVSALVEGAETTTPDGSSDDAFACEEADRDAASANAGSLYDLTDTTQLDSAEAARAGVDNGDYVAAIIIPADFTAKSSPDLRGGGSIEPVSVEVYASGASPIQASIVRSITEAITNQIATGQIAIAATSDVLGDEIQQNPSIGMHLQSLSEDEAAAQFDFACAFTPGYAPVNIAQETVSGEATGETGGFNPLVYFGAANAVFFMMFTAQGGATDLLGERRRWTLQRLIASPTPRPVILLGKLIGTLVNCIVQMIALFIALTLIGSLIAGEFQFIWGRNVPAILLVVVSAAVAAAGLGTLITGLVRSEEQANVIGSAVVIVMGLLGGTFFPVETIQNVPFLKNLPLLTINHWAIDAFQSLALGQTDILLNAGVLLVLGLALFGIGWWAFNRQLDI